MRGALKIAVLSGGIPGRLYDDFNNPNGIVLNGKRLKKGGTWTTVLGVGATWDVQNGRARLLKGSGSRDFAWAEANVSEGTVECTVNAGVGCTPGVSGRVTDENNQWDIRFHPGGSTFSIFERNASVFTERAFVSVASTAGTDNKVKAVFSGTTITATLNGGSEISYGSASFNQTATKFGLHSLNDATGVTDTFENFVMKG